MYANLITSMPMYVCAFWSVLLLLDVITTRQVAKGRLLAYMVAATVLYSGHYVFFNHLTGLLPLSDTFYCTTNLAVFPLYYLYIKELTEPHWNRRWQWLLLVPAVIFGGVVGLLYVLMSPAETATFIDSYLYHNQMEPLTGLAWWQAFVHHGAKAVFALMIPPIVVLGFRKISRYNEAVEANYADTDERRLWLVKTILVLFVVAALLSFAANAAGRYRFAGSLWLLPMSSVGFSVLQFLLGYAGHRQTFGISNLLHDMETNTPEAAHATTAPAVEETEQSNILDELPALLTTTVSQELLYLQPDLKITDVAHLLHTNRTYISRVLKEEMGTTFADFINRQRIDHACKLMQQQPQPPVNELARDSGFSSVSSFYRNFKLYKGCSPKDYLPPT